MNAYPARLQHSTERPDLVYERASDLFALPAAAAQRAQATVLRSLDAGDGLTLQLCSGVPGAGMDEARAVYCAVGGVAGGAVDGAVDGATGSSRPAGKAASAAASPATAKVPSGQLFVRFADGVQAISQTKALAAAGCRVVSVPAYAPQAAWLAPAGEDPAQALCAIAQLEALPDMVNVEPQWLAPRALKA